MACNNKEQSGQDILAKLVDEILPKLKGSIPAIVCISMLTNALLFLIVLLIVETVKGHI